MDLIKFILSRISNIPEADVIAVSPQDNGSIYLIIIHSNHLQPHIDYLFKDIKDIRILYFSELEILTSILRDGGRIISRILSNPIIIKDRRKLMPIIAQYIQGDNNDLEHFTTLGELSIVFNNVSESKVFIANTLFPFLGITKGYINNAHKFCVSSRTIYGNQKVCISWDLIDSDFIYEEFLKLLVDSIPEINLHTMRVYHNDVVKTSITSLQNWSTSCFIQNFNRDNLDDIVILNIFTQYITIAQTLPLTVSDFYFRNRLVLDKMLINSLSSITQGIIPNAIYENLKSKIASEYNIIMNNNIVELSSIINSLCASWATTGKKNLPPDVTEEVDRLYSCKGVECLIDIYDTIFCTSLLHTFHSGFIPYCINELLPSISKI